MTQLHQTLGGTEPGGPAPGSGDHDHDLKEHLRDLTQEMVTLVRQEIELLKAELSEKTDFLKEQIQLTEVQVRQEVEKARVELAEAGKKAGIGAGLFAAAGLLGLGAFGALTAALIAGLGEAMPIWTGALLATAIYGVAAGGLALAGRTRMQKVGAPVETIGRLKSLFNFRTKKIRNELASVPAETVGSLSSVKDDLHNAWQQGNRHRGGK